MATKFQGYAQRSGFQESDPGYAALAKMQERDDRVISGLRENLRALETRNRQSENDLQRAQSQQEQNRKDIFIEEDVFRNQEAALNQNISTTRRNKDAVVKKALDPIGKLNSLAKFSETLATGLIAVRKKDIKATVDDEYHKALVQGTPFNVREKQALSEQILNNYGTQIEGQADMAAMRGAMPRSVAEIRGFNQARDYGRLKAYAKLAGENWAMHAQTELNRLGITDPEGAAVALKVIHLDYLRAHNLYGLSTEFLTDAHDEMRKGRNAILTEMTASHVKGQNDQYMSQRLSEYRGSPNEETTYNLFRQKSGYSDGKSYNNRTDGVNYLFNEVFADPRLTPDLDKALNFRTKNEKGEWGQTWAEKFPHRIPELMKSRGEKEAEIARAEQTADKVEQHKVEKETKDWIDKEWDLDIKNFRSVKKDLELQGYNTDFMNIYEARSIQHQNQDWIKSDLDESVENGTLSVFHEDDVRLLTDKEDRKYYFDLIKENETAARGSFQSDKISKDDFKSQLKTALGEEQVLGNDAVLTLNQALHYANSQYLQKRYSLRKYGGKDAGTASKEAYDYVMKLILDGEGKFEVVNGRKDTSIKNDSPLKQATFFKEFVPQSMYKRGYTANLTPQNNYINSVKEVQQDKTVIDKKPLVSENKLRQEAIAYENGKGVDIPAIYYDLHKADPSLGTPEQIFLRQLATLEPPIKVNPKGEDWRSKWASDSTDPSGEKLIQKIDSLDGVARTYEIIYNNGASNPKYMSNRTQKLIIPGYNEAPAPVVASNPIMSKLSQVSGGMVNDETFQFVENKEGKPELIPFSPEATNWLIDNGADYGWYFNYESGNFEYTEL